MAVSIEDFPINTQIDENDSDSFQESNTDSENEVFSTKFDNFEFDEISEQNAFKIPQFSSVTNSSSSSLNDKVNKILEYKGNDEIKIDNSINTQKSSEKSIKTDNSEEEDEFFNTITEIKSIKTKKNLKTESSDANDSSMENFLNLNLSRPILKILSSLNFNHPTPVQNSAIPKILLGKDLIVSAITGTGKTAAFLLPIIERLLKTTISLQNSRVLIVCPTRELAVQCFSMTQTFCTHTTIRSCLIVGGLSMNVQQIALSKNPDIIIGTPGRIIDHLQNSKSFHLNDIEILVLDEADRLLSMGFQAEVNQILTNCPPERQTLLFSATMSKNVQSLAKISLKNPEMIQVDPLFSLANKLRQSFYRLPHDVSDNYRYSVVLALCKKFYKNSTLIFCSSKSEAHLLTMIFLLVGLKASELHGNMTQAQRLDALESFRTGTVSFLIATDLAARGLDIPNLKTVINVNLPKSLSSYVHRVGRTARAGNQGVSITLVSRESKDRNLLKQIVSSSSKKCNSISVSFDKIEFFLKKIKEMQGDIKKIYREEREEKEIRIAEMNANKTSNLILYDDEIHSRPAKTWFQSEKQKKLTKKLSSDMNEDEQEKLLDLIKQNKEKKKMKEMKKNDSQNIHDKNIQKVAKSKLRHNENISKTIIENPQSKRVKKRYLSNINENADSFEKRYKKVAADTENNDIPKKKKKEYHMHGAFKSKMKYKRRKK